MATSDRSVLDGLFFIIALFAMVVLLSVVAVAIVGGIVSGAPAGGSFGTPELIASFLASVLLIAALTGLVLDQTRY